MSRQKSVLNEAIDQSIERLVVRRGDEGFGYGDVELRVRTSLGGNMDEILMELGNSKLRDRIRERTRAVSRSQMSGLAALHPDLFEPDAEVIYPIRGGDGETRFKQIAHMSKEEFSDVVRDLIVQKKGLEKHIKALRNIEFLLAPIWKDHPRLIIEEAQQYLDPAAA